MKRRKCSLCGANKSLLREFLPGATECMNCRVGKTMPPTVYDVHVHDHSFKMTFDGAVTTWEVFQRVLGEREVVTTGVLEALVWDGAHVLELGACFGYFTLQLADLVGPTGRVVSLEPRDDYSKLLLRNVKLNNTKTVQTEALFVHSDPAWKSKYRGQYVESLSATLCAERYFPRRYPDLLFMDIEGYEHDALADLCKTGWLEAARPTLVWEIHGPVDEGDPDNEAIIVHLQKAGYQVHRAGKLNIGRHV